MMTKILFRQQIIIFIGNDNILKFMLSLSEHIANINRTLKSIKSNTLANFVQVDHQELIITIKVILMSNLSTIENYTKNVNNIESNDIILFCFPQSKFYLKIIDIIYLMKNINILINSSIVKTIIKNIHIFNNMLLIFKP